jgi:hypothetical protein
MCNVRSFDLQNVHFMIDKSNWAFGHAMAQVVSRRPLTAETGFAPGSIHVTFVVDKVSLGQVFLRVLRFSPVNISLNRRSPNSHHLGNF